MAGKKPEEMTSQEVSDAVGLDKIEDTKKREAIAQRLYERRQELISEKAAARRGFLTERIGQIDKTKKDANAILEEIVAELQRARIEEDRFNDFEVPNHGIDGKTDSLFSGGYAGWYHNRMVEYGISAEADVKEYALNTFVLPAILAVPSRVKRQYRNLYAVQAIDAYVKAMDEYEGLTDVLTKEEVRQHLKMQTFDEWLKANKQLSEQEIYLKYDKIDQAALAASEGTLKTIEERLKEKSLSEEDRKKFQQRSEAIRKRQVENPQKAKEDAQKLLQDIESVITAGAAAAAFGATISSIEEKLKLETIPADKKEEFKKRFEEIRKKKEASPEEAKSEADTLLQDIEASISPPEEEAKEGEGGKEAEAGAPKEGEEGKEINFFEDPIGYLKKKHQFIYGVIAFLGLEGFIRGLFSKAKGKGSGFGARIESWASNLFLSKKMKLGKKVLVEKLDFSSPEAGKLLDMKVGDAIKAGAPPPEIGIDKKKFAFLQESLKLNGGDENTEDAVGDFIGEKSKDWKLPEKEGEAVAEASEGEAEPEKPADEVPKDAPPEENA
jgi:hypothetical protein